MKEQNEKEQEQKKKKVKVKLSGEKRFYLLTALGCAAALIAIIVVAVAVSVGGGSTQQAGNNGGNGGNAVNSSAPAPDDSTGGNEQGSTPDGDEQVTVTPEGMIMPVETVSVLNDYGFYHNATLNSYYVHTGLDFSAAAGTEVLAVEAGTVESIYKDDLLSGTEITVNHGDGLKSVYRFVTEAEGLAVGDTVEKGEVIATVAEANGDEYKDGAHLHFEIVKNDESVDPTEYLTLEEK